MTPDEIARARELAKLCLSLEAEGKANVTEATFARYALRALESLEAYRRECEERLAEVECLKAILDAERLMREQAQAEVGIKETEMKLLRIDGDEFASLCIAAGELLDAIKHHSMEMTSSHGSERYVSTKILSAILDKVYNQ